MNKHTPGPWTAREAGADWKVGASDGRTFDVGDALYHPENGANARLIAAAPTMRSFIEMVARCSVGDVPPYEEAKAILEEIDGSS